MVAVDAGSGTATRLGRRLGRAVRIAFALLLLGGLLGAALTAARQEPLSTLRDDLGAGRVSEVTFADGASPLHMQRDDPQPRVRWKVVGSGWRVASLAGDFSDGGIDSGPADSTVDGSTQIPVEKLIRDRVRAAGVPIATTTPPVPRLLAGLSTLAGVLLVLVLIGAPQPRRATKWAWFWLMLVPAGLTQLAWLAVEAPWSERVNRRPEPRPHRDQPGDTRLTGGRAFLLSLLLGAVIGWAGWRVAGWLAG